VTWGQGLWPHASGSRDLRDGVTISRYMMSNLGTQLTLYTFAHECGHMLFGWPDLYGYGDYCLMGNASNPRNPAGINDFYRADQGWIPVTTVTATSNARYGAAAGTGGFRYVNPAKPGELFFWSYVQNSARFSVLRGSGILMMHFDKSIGVNNPPAKLGLAVVEADGRNDLGATMWPSPGSAANDFFRAGSEFSDTSTPMARWNDGTRTGLRVYDIAAAGSGMEFSVGTGMLPADAGVISPPDAGSVDAGAPGADGGASGGDGGVPSTDASAPIPGVDAGSSTDAATPGRDAGTGTPGTMADASATTGPTGADAARPLSGTDAAATEAGTSPTGVDEGDDGSEGEDGDGCTVKPGARRSPLAFLFAALGLLGLRRRRAGA
jgi:MYXO-CTERM domain-containing protein